jgi:hypothetical protein
MSRHTIFAIERSGVAIMRRFLLELVVGCLFLSAIAPVSQAQTEPPTKDQGQVYFVSIIVFSEGGGKG